MTSRKISIKKSGTPTTRRPTKFADFFCFLLMPSARGHIGSHNHTRAGSAELSATRASLGCLAFQFIGIIEMVFRILFRPSHFAIFRKGISDSAYSLLLGPDGKNLLNLALETYGSIFQSKLHFASIFG